jgi:hypothetical protein
MASKFDWPAPPAATDGAAQNDAPPRSTRATVSFSSDQQPTSNGGAAEPHDPNAPAAPPKGPLTDGTPRRRRKLSHFTSSEVVEDSVPLVRVSEEHRVKEAQVELAAILIRNAMEGVFDPLWYIHRERWVRMNQYEDLFLVKITRAMVVIFLVLLPFFEEPAWCRRIDRQLLYERSYLQNPSPLGHPPPVPSIDDMPACGEVLIYPRSGVPTWPFSVSLIMSFTTILLIMLAYVFPRFIILGYDRKRKETYVVVVIVLCTLSIIDLIITSASPALTTFRLAPILRPILFVVLVPRVRSVGAAALGSAQAVLPILLCLLVLITFFGWIACLYFLPDTPAGKLWFYDYSESLWSLQILLTTANNPDIKLAALQSHRASNIFFVLFMILGLWFLYNVLLSGIYASYVKAAYKRASRFKQARESGLKQAFRLVRERHWSRRNTSRKGQKIGVTELAPDNITGGAPNKSSLAITLNGSPLTHDAEMSTKPVIRQLDGALKEIREGDEANSDAEPSSEHSESSTPTAGDLEASSSSSPSSSGSRAASEEEAYTESARVEHQREQEAEEKLERAAQKLFHAEHFLQAEDIPEWNGGRQMEEVGERRQSMSAAGKGPSAPSNDDIYGNGDASFSSSSPAGWAVHPRSPFHISPQPIASPQRRAIPPYVSFNTCLHLLTALWKVPYPTTLQAQSQLNPVWNRARLYFLQLDRHGRGKLEEADFNELCHVLTKDRQLQADMQRGKFILPARWRLWNARWFKMLSLAFIHPWRKTILFVMLVAHTAVLVMESIEWTHEPFTSVNGVYCSHRPSVSLIPHAVSLQVIDLILVGWYVVEASVEVLTQGWFPWMYDKTEGNMHVFQVRQAGSGNEEGKGRCQRNWSIKEKFDVCSFCAVFRLQLCWVVSVVIVELVQIGNLDSIACASAAMPTILTLRALRVLRPLLLEPRISAVITTYIRLLPKLACLFALLWALMMGATQIGMMIFGGVIWVGNPLIKSGVWFDFANYYMSVCKT